jgi:hypothetical protein
MGPGWWVASDGKWYPPRETDDSPAPGWWLAADGKWYPPREAEDPPAPGWWLASDGKWYPPDDATPQAAPSTTAALDDPSTPPEPLTPLPTELATPPELAPTPAAAPSAAPTEAPATTASSAGTTSNGAPRRPNTAAAPLDASEQIRRRNQASRDDAVAQFPARFLAAARAVQVLESELGRAEDLREHPRRERKGRARAEARAAAASIPTAPPTGAPADAPPPDAVAPASPAAVPGPPPAAPPEPPPTVPVGRPTAQPGDHDGWPAPRPLPGDRSPRIGQPGGPLIELRPSPLGTDLDHLGDRLLVFADRVELHDRSDHIRQSIGAKEIADVGVQRKFTGAVLTIAAFGAEPIVVKGIKPEQADEVQRLIHTRVRLPGAAADASNGAATDADTPPEESALAAPSPDAVSAAADRLAILNRSRLNEADLLRKLADLHRAGVLSDAEFSDKIALVGRLVSGETIVVV